MISRFGLVSRFGWFKACSRVNFLKDSLPPLTLLTGVLSRTPLTLDLTGVLSKGLLRLDDTGVLWNKPCSPGRVLLWTPPIPGE